MSPPGAAALADAFRQLLQDHDALIAKILSHHLGPDHQDAAQELAIRLSRVFPSKHAKLLADQAAGRPSDHSWPKYIARAARRIASAAAVDRQRDRSHLVSLDRRRAAPVACGAPDDPDPYPLTAGDCWPDPTAADPAAAGPLADVTGAILDALRQMTPDVRDAAVACLQEWRDAEYGRDRKCSTPTARRRRLTAQKLLAKALAAAGCVDHRK